MLRVEHLTAEEAASLAGLTSSTIRRAIRAGRLAGERKGNLWLIERTAFDAWAAVPRPHGPPRGYKRVSRD